MSHPVRSNGWILFIQFDSVRVLSHILQDIDDILPERDLTSTQNYGLDEIAQGCCIVLQKLEETLDKYQELDSSSKGVSGKSRRVWKRLQWNQKDIDQFRNRINLNIGAFGAFLGQINR